MERRAHREGEAGAAALVLAAALWAALAAAALMLRPPLPVDETRYLAVAWEMWHAGDFLVPRLNGEPYSHKPPLLFWLMHAGWAVFGVNDWWPRLVAPLAALASLALVRAVAARLWPDGGAPAAPLALAGLLAWALYATLTMFDMLLACATLVGLWGVLAAWRGAVTRGFAALALAIGLGLLAKGPAILVHLLPVALLAPWWGGAPGAGAAPAWGRWYGGVAGALALGLAIGLAWALPAAAAGGAAYAEALLWGQTAGRMVEAFDHGRPWWWYLPWLPALVLPHLLWPGLWRGWRRWRGAGADGGARFCLAWLGAAVVVFSAISGKQAHYLLPELPALALFIARSVDGAPAGDGAAAGRRPLLAPGLAFAVVGALLFAAPLVVATERLRQAADGIAWEWGLLLAAAGAAVALAPRPRDPLAGLGLLSAAAVVTLHLALAPLLAAGYDLSPVAARLGQWERAGVPLAHFGTYHGQFHFLGRLTKPMPEIGLRHPDVETWLAAHPTGKVVSYRRAPPGGGGGPEPAFVQPFRGGFIVVWDAAQMIAHPGLADRKS